MQKAVLTKATALMLAFILTFANVLLLGIYAQETIAITMQELEEQDVNVNNANMTFDAYFLEGEQGAETKIHSKVIDVETNNGTLYAEIKVTDGYLASGTISIQNTNINLMQIQELPESVQSIDVENNEVTLNKIESGETVILSLPIKLNTASDFDVQNIDRESDVVMQGHYVNVLGNEREITKTIKVRASMTAQAETEFAGEITEYVQEEINEQKITILQFVLKSNLVNNILPVKNTQLEIEIPEINEIAPETISVSALSTKATNGMGRKVYANSEYTYENGKIGLTIINEEVSGRISWMKDSQDEIMVTCVYGETVTALEDIEINANSKITLYTDESIVTKDLVKTVLAQESTGKAISYEIDVHEEEIHKGYMVVTSADNTPYTENLKVNIGAKEIVDSINLSNVVKYLDNGSNQYPSNPIYKYTKISREDLVGIFGEDGYINLYGENEELIATLNKNNTEYEYEEETTVVTIQTSKPQTEGIFEIENRREIKPLEYSKAQINNFVGMKMTLNGNVTLNNANVSSLADASNDTIELQNPTEQASLKLNVENLSTVITNEGVEFRTTLKTTDTSTVLYKNPTIEYILPKYIKDISIKRASVLYDRDLEITGIVIDENNSGNIIIRILTQGEQTAFNQNALVEGATIIIRGDITVDELTPTLAENIIMNVTNGATNNTITENVPVNFVAPVGMMTVNQIFNFNNQNGTVTSISGRAETGDLEIEAGAKTANVKITVINNNEEECENITILGRIPYEGNKDIIDEAELGSTFTANMSRAIQAETEGLTNHFTVYYSANGETTKDLSNAENGWTENISDLSSVKSYMIVMNDYTLQVGDTLCFSYDIEIPENLVYDKSAYETYVVYYNKAQGAQITEIAKATVAGITTGQGPNLSVTLISNVNNGAEIEEGEIITNTVRIINNKTIQQDGVSLNLKLSNNVTYLSQAGTITQNENGQEVSIPIGTLVANETKEITFEIRVGSFAEEAQSNENQISIKGIVNVEGYEGTFETEEKHNTIIAEGTSTEIIMNISNVLNDEYRAGDTVQYLLYVGTKETETLNNVVITCNIPDGLMFDDAGLNGEYDENTKTVTWNFDTLNSARFFALTCTVDNLTGDLYETEIPIVLNAKSDESTLEYSSNVYTIKVVKDGFTLSQTSNIIDGKIAANDEITYEITVKNLSTITSSITITDYFPSGFDFVKFQYTRNGQTIQRNENSGIAAQIPITLDAGETVIVYLTLKVDDYNEVNDEITNRVVLNSSEIKDLESTLVNYKFGEDEEDNNSNGGNGEETENSDNSTYRISGIVWVDTNKNGQRESGEELKQGIEVLLLDSQTNDVVQRTETDENGIYVFNDIVKKQYIVAFNYDTLEYDVTTYQAEGVNSSVNSDAINMLLKVDDKISTYAVTDTIYVSSNMYNIDLGLVVSKKFDLEFTKSIALIQTSNTNGTQNYTFDNEKTAKVEIPGKEIAGTVVAVTYNFTIENKGAISGYVNKIVDYIPSDMSFTSSLNPEWYKDTDGNLYNVSLANRLIEPGEKVELSLILNKTMTEENMGVVNNGAEIYEASNDYNISDLDSTPANRAISEDDYGSADAIITVKTGQAIMYFGITLIVAAIFGAGLYMIKKKVLEIN